MTLKVKGGGDQNSTKEKYYERICSFKPDALIVVCAQTWTLDWIMPYLDMLKKHLSLWLPENSSKKVVFNVHLSREEVCELYRSSDVFVCTSRSENCPIVHCEAAVTGMAVISPDVGDVRLKDDIILIENVKQLREAMESLHFDREELWLRGEKLRKYMLSRNCRAEDKIDWLEKEVLLTNRH